ncbi:MAG: hypothetical protein OXI66_15895 [Boseongicola sp.]|nr:hypothetical protein [Boseongicola sp.]MXW85868.1 hypothetical protein [Boseongicola sp. SB0667_bin_21]MYI70273.1 hypothetical protein [Boseongicola sp. SB0673_bin_14]
MIAAPSDTHSRVLGVNSAMASMTRPWQHCPGRATTWELRGLAATMEPETGVLSTVTPAMSLPQSWNVAFARAG